MPNLQSFSQKGEWSEQITDLQSCEYIALENMTGLRDLWVLPRPMSRLRSVKLVKCRELLHMEGLDEFPGIEELIVLGSRSLDVRAVIDLPALKRFVVTGLDILDDETRDALERRGVLVETSTI